jgi:hypothetical protein
MPVGATGVDEGGAESWADVAAAVPTEVARASLRLNRRASPRRKSSGTALMVARGVDGQVTFARVEIADANAGGMGLRSAVGVEVGARVALYFNGQSLPGRSGVVSRCTVCAGGFRVGVTVDEVVASALRA